MQCFVMLINVRLNGQTCRLLFSVHILFSNFFYVNPSRCFSVYIFIFFSLHLLFPSSPGFFLVFFVYQPLPSDLLYRHLTYKHCSHITSFLFLKLACHSGIYFFSSISFFVFFVSIAFSFFCSFISTFKSSFFISYPVSILFLLFQPFFVGHFSLMWPANI